MKEDMREKAPQNRTAIVQVKSGEDLHRITELTSGILGELCWEARLGYRDELKLEIGAKKTDELGDYGAWMLGSRGTAWKLMARDGTLITEYYERDVPTPDEVRENIQTIANNRITAFEVLYPTLGLEVTFDNGNKLLIAPTDYDDEWDLPYWELYTPDGVLMVGPNMQWAYES